MQKTSTNTRIGIACASALFLLAGILHLFESFGSPFVKAVLFLSTNLIYIGLIIVWGVSIRQRLLQNSAMRSLLTVCALMVLWILLRSCKYKYFESLETVQRYLWYGYYIPQLFGPVFGLLAALCLGQAEKYKPPKVCSLLFIPSALLCALIMTNDLHQLAFRFQPGFSNWNNVYEHGIVYMIAIIYLGCLLIGSFCILYIRCRKHGENRFVGIPVLIFTLGLCLCLLSFADIIKMFKLPELFCATYASTWEACIQVGLVPSNINYKGFFSVSTIAARITDSSGLTRYSAKGAKLLSEQQMKQAQESPMLLDANTRLHAHVINGGHVYWLANIATINRMNDELGEKRALLTEEVEIARAESKIKAQKAQIEEQNRVYDHIALIARPQLARLDTLFTDRKPDEYDSRLKTACILGAYIKRRLNLQLIAESAAFMQADELYYCLRESAEYLSIGGVLCECVQGSNGEIPSGAILFAYDFFQSAIEAALPTLSSLFIKSGIHGENLELRLVMEDAKNTLPTDWHKEALIGQLGNFDCQITDGTLFYTLHLQKGGNAR